MSLKQVIEALLFASQKPLLAKEILAALRSAAEDSEDSDVLAFAKVKEPQVVEVLEELRADYVGLGRAFQLVDAVSGWQLVSDPSCALWVRQLYPESKPTRLSGPALETLAIIAYRQPLTRADIEAVRGVAVDGMVQTLLEKGLIRIAGRADVPGRPLLYETTQYFLEHFGLRSLDELPNSSELRRIKLAPAKPAALAPPVEEQMALGQKGAPAAQPDQTDRSDRTDPSEEAGASRVRSESTRRSTVERRPRSKRKTCLGRLSNG